MYMNFDVHKIQLKISKNCCNMKLVLRCKSNPMPLALHMPPVYILYSYVYIEFDTSCEHNQVFTYFYYIIYYLSVDRHTYANIHDNKVCTTLSNMFTSDGCHIQ